MLEFYGVRIWECNICNIYILFHPISNIFLLNEHAKRPDPTYLNQPDITFLLLEFLHNEIDQMQVQIKWNSIVFNRFLAENEQKSRLFTAHPTNSQTSNKKAEMGDYCKMDTNEYSKLGYLNIIGCHIIMYKTNIRIYLDATYLLNEYPNILIRWK